MSTRILALLGANVIKIEGPQWLDSWRGPISPARFEQYPDSEPGARPYNRCVRFNAQNLGKFDVVLDLKSEEGRGVLRRIVPKVDAVVANYIAALFVSRILEGCFWIIALCVQAASRSDIL